MRQAQTICPRMHHARSPSHLLGVLRVELMQGSLVFLHLSFPFLRLLPQDGDLPGVGCPQLIQGCGRLLKPLQEDRFLLERSGCGCTCGEGCGGVGVWGCLGMVHDVILLPKLVG